ncbi:unnamed protein product [Haemonchus placei]|uniref:Phlebovirus glycoprotein G2 fusion domain-containing protein n=1 Tax=Haemonchus placei TaxID=6290 RepID=A0A0N4X0R0_HAEPC|nr:unnamed protein product [Haemonchus placei]
MDRQRQSSVTPKTPNTQQSTIQMNQIALENIELSLETRTISAYTIESQVPESGVGNPTVFKDADYRKQTLRNGELTKTSVSRPIRWLQISSRLNYCEHGCPLKKRLLLQCKPNGENLKSNLQN